MNENADRSPGRPRRAGVLAVGLAGIALLAAACSGSPAAPASKAYQQFFLAEHATALDNVADALLWRRTWAPGWCSKTSPARHPRA